jgi:CheY-like chemotaxis protein/anti-sigma regulatory factor (Ser/Thr protein kinase)
MGRRVIRKKPKKAIDDGPFEVEFLSLLAHELRNPLAPILHSAAILRMLCTNEAQLKAIATIDRQVNLLARLVDDLVEGARLQRGLVSLEKQWVDIGELAGQALEAMQPKAEAQGQHLAAQLPTVRLQMLCDPVRLRQVLDNLLDNASSHTQAGGTITLAIEARQHELLIRISDNGLGIAPDALPHVFNMHSAAAPTAGSSVKRLGVGLAITRSLVELHGGAIRAESAGPGRGSTFVATLPLVSDPTRKNAELQQAPAAPSLRVLVVDDNIDAAQSLAELLALQGHIVEKAYDAASALQVVETFRPSIVLLDIALPDLDGYEVASRLRARPELKDVRLIALTAFGSSKRQAQSRAAGFNGHLTKPVSIEALKRALADKD